ncbi:NAD(P)-dependent iron-only hydrogenase catalytic subunit [Alkalithermobacter thermoalcaliphilus JW-YL-7 = DSM 7308]|uniref:Hydrogenase, Fe-only n=1 Tax=Alkalithermobacter thermoalcaliphilus JW-YL-7 = DSM 7308 TaxID=1121328 RepID=A0A150FS52_CLOPD|nr:hydrogenase, Fe-only [[Clostridium] paradoxum JW-YL-7 = DSM 7308]SHK79835.1 NAD(P)-dependent iron-only hydrogenase catalytic subunit [[Clostridium] paradoxum JW-YL-7 = DSM 7308]
MENIREDKEREIKQRKVSINIDGIDYEVPDGITVLEAARMVNIEIPSLCYLKDINEIGACRVCMVEIDGLRNLQASCVYPVKEGLRIKTNTKRVLDARKTAVTLLLSNHHRECLTCARNLNCELQNLSDKLGIRNIPYTGEMKDYGFHNNNPAIQRDYNKCVNCRRCMAICSKIQECNVYSAINRGLDTVISPAFHKDMNDVTCIMCGQCILACPTASLNEKEDIDDVWKVLSDPDKFVVAQTAPSIQVTIGEIFDMPIGSFVGGKLVSALRRIGFDKVFATDVTADLTIMEEGSELIERLIHTPEKLPLLSSCCPGWVKFAEHFYPEFLPNLSTTKSPHEMCGALTKTWYAKKYNIDPSKIVNVAIMPCTAKKYEAARPEMTSDGYRNVDFVLTTRELGKMIRQLGLDFKNLPEDNYDEPFDQFSGAGTIFGATGGVLEAAIRTAHKLLTGEEMDVPDFEEARGQSGLKYSQVTLKDKTITIAIAHGTGNAKKALEMFKSGEKKFDYMEVMACPGGCVGGGGQPILGGKDHNHISLGYRHNRSDTLYNIDKNKSIRRSHENPRIHQIYEEFLGKPLSEISHKYLHTTFTPRGKHPYLKEVD